jgi:hypothetical protein
MKPMNETARLVLELLENTSFADSIRSYSGRGMEGKLCLGVEIPRNSLFELGYEMARAVYSEAIWADTSIVPAPHTDSMGHDMIAYWPSAKITCPIEDMEEVDE